MKLIPGNYIYLWHKIKYSSFYSEKPFDELHAWIDLLLRAQLYENWTYIGNKYRNVPSGSFITTQQELADSWGWAKSHVNTFLKKLEKSERSIRVETERTHTQIWLVKWSFYQPQLKKRERKN